MNEAEGTHQEKDPAEDGSAGGQAPSSAPSALIPTVLPEIARMPTHTLPGALQEAEELPRQHQLMRLIKGWAEADHRRMEQERDRADRLQGEFTASKVQCARLEEQLRGARRYSFLENFLNIIGGALIGAAITFSVDGKWLLFWACLIAGGFMIAAASVPHIPWTRGRGD